jgi:hypothetical protein
MRVTPLFLLLLFFVVPLALIVVVSFFRYQVLVGLVPDFTVIVLLISGVLRFIIGRLSYGRCSRRQGLNITLKRFSGNLGETSNFHRSYITIFQQFEKFTMTNTD